MNEESTQSKTIKKTATQSAKKETAPKVVSFYFPKGNNSVFVWGRTNADGEKIASVSARVESNMIRVAPSTINGDFIIKTLRKAAGNSANGGNVFEEVEVGVSASSNSADRIDQLTAMDKKSLVALLGGGVGLNRLTKGALIAQALELD